MFLKNEQQLRCVQEQKVNISESFVLYEGKYTGPIFRAIRLGKFIAIILKAIQYYALLRQRC